MIIDDGEIIDMEWTTPAAALTRHHEGEIEIVPPTWVTLDTLTGHSNVASLLAFLDARPARHYATRVARGAEPPVVMWEGDAGYDGGDASTEGPRHRLTMAPDGYVYESSLKTMNISMATRSPWSMNGVMNLPVSIFSSIRCSARQEEPRARSSLLTVPLPTMVPAERDRVRQRWAMMSKKLKNISGPASGSPYFLPLRWVISGR